MDNEIAKRFEKLEVKIAALEAENKSIIDGNEYGWDRHYQIHSDLNKMIYASYFKTHPEFCQDLDKFDEIVSGKKPNTDKSKS